MIFEAMQPEVDLVAAEADLFSDFPGEISGGQTLDELSPPEQMGLAGPRSGESLDLPTFLIGQTTRLNFDSR